MSKRLLNLWDKFHMKVNSKGRHLVDFIQIVNLMYIALFTPLMIGFSINMGKVLNSIEFGSLIISFAWIIANFRTEMLIKGESTMQYEVLLRHYKENGLYLDIFGIIPFNIILG